MPQVLIDHNFDERAVRRLQERMPALEILFARSAGLAMAPDAELLDEALLRGWITPTHDASTIPPLVHEKLTAGQASPRVIVVVTGTNQSQAVDDLELTLLCSTETDWQHGIIWVPL